ncbi:hypothetical protein Tco_1092097 [Tanacetum coccineum]|uniref:Uncharacterized protein n=1 Tax=Tanacetum coccineum TaxID=301880 RepID=A0ABQ5I8W2_9ASTR
MNSDHNSSELGIHDHINEQSSLKLVPKVVPQADKAAISRQEIHKDEMVMLIPWSRIHYHMIMLKRAKTYYSIKIQRLHKAQELKTSTNSDIQDLPSKISSLSREIVSKLSR